MLKQSIRGLQKIERSVKILNSLSILNIDKVLGKIFHQFSVIFKGFSNKEDIISIKSAITYQQSCNII